MLKIWDIWIRVFHWSFAIAVCFLLVSGETGVGFFDWHKPIGELVVALVVFRLAWGFIGSSNARLVSLFQNPKLALTHLLHLFRRKPGQHLGHNAAGGWAVLLMLVTIGVQALTGLFIADEDEFIEGRFYGTFGTEVSDFIYSVHHTNAEFIQILIVVHIAMVILYLVWGRQNLIKPMITGRIQWLGSSKPSEDVRFSPVWLGLLLFLVVAAFFAWLFLV